MYGHKETTAAVYRTRQRVKIDWEKITERVSREMKTKAVGWSRGKFKQHRLTKMGHPYAVRHPKYPATTFPHIINLQSGRLLKSWAHRSSRRAATVWNTAPYFGYLHHGTVRMVDRPIIYRLKLYGETLRSEMAAKAVYSAVKKVGGKK